MIGLEQIAVFHVNDSLNPLGAHKDRHANIGKGTIGYDTLHRLVHDETLQMYQRFWKHHGFVRRALRRRLFLLIKRKLNGFLNKKVAKIYGEVWYYRQ